MAQDHLVWSLTADHDDNVVASNTELTEAQVCPRVLSSPNKEDSAQDIIPVPISGPASSGAAPETSYLTRTTNGCNDRTTAQPSLRGGGNSKDAGVADQGSASPRTLSTYKDVASQIRAGKCQKCNKHLIERPRDVEELFQSWKDGKTAFSSKIKCKHCSTSTCVGCGGKSTTSTAAEVKALGNTINWCCPNGALCLVWVILCAFDQQYCKAKQREAATRGTGITSADRGVGYGGRNTGSYIGPRRDTRPVATPESIKAQKTQEAADHFDKAIFIFLAEVIGSQAHKSSPNNIPSEALVSMLLNSQILNKTAELLRNDSLEDAGKRFELYQALVNFLRSVTTQKALFEKSLLRERQVWPESMDLLTLSFEKRPDTKKRQNASSLSDLLRTLNIQSDMLIRGAQRNHDFKDTHGQHILKLCQQICDLSDVVLPKTSAGTGLSSLSEVKRDADHFVVTAPDELVFASHTYARMARSQTESPRGRMKRIVTEITSLKTGLPPGIFVKFASSRLDVMKIIIVGPSDTPYENGLFEFDLWCPQEYPYQPPKVWFRTTKGGHVLFNPNLHEDGKVCLSILNTWPGEPWRPGVSTILQVLVSIQAMILCETPFANNPGIESLGRYQDENEAYNRGIRAATVRVAMIPWLQSPPEIWKDVVGLHFKKNAEKILQKVGQWEEMELRARLRNPGMRLTMGTTIGMPEDMSGVRQQLHGALQRFGAISRSHTLSQVNRPEQIHGSSRTSHAHGYGGYGSRGPGGQSRRW